MDQPGQARDMSGGVAMVDDPPGGGPIKERDYLRKIFLKNRLVFLFQRLADLSNGRFEGRSDRFVPVSPLQALTMALDRRDMAPLGKFPSLFGSGRPFLAGGGRFFFFWLFRLFFYFFSHGWNFYLLLSKSQLTTDGGCRGESRIFPRLKRASGFAGASQ